MINAAWSNSRVSYNNSGGVGIPIDTFGSKGEPLPEHEQTSRTVPTSSPNALLYATTSISGSGQPTDDTPLGRGHIATQEPKTFHTCRWRTCLTVESCTLESQTPSDSTRAIAECNVGGNSTDIMAALKALEFSLVPGLGDRPFDNSDRHYVEPWEDESTPEQPATVTERTEGFVVHTHGQCDPKQDSLQQEYVNVDRQMNNERYSCACLSADRGRGTHALTPGRVAFFYNHALQRQAFVGKILCVYRDIDMDAFITQKGVTRRGEYLLVIAMTLVDGLWCFDEDKLHVQVIHEDKADHGVLWLAAKCCSSQNVSTRG